MRPVWPTSPPSEDKEIARPGRDGRSPPKSESGLDLCAEHREHLRGAGRAVDTEAPEHRTTNHDRAGTERERLHHVDSAADAAVDIHLRVATDRVDHLREHVGGGGDAVEHATAVVRH